MNDNLQKLHEMTGLAKEELIWLWLRIKHLIEVDGFTPRDAGNRAAMEAKEKPWNTAKRS